jgi:hypothetical protein
MAGTLPVVTVRRSSLAVILPLVEPAQATD